MEELNKVIRKAEEVVDASKALDLLVNQLKQLINKLYDDLENKKLDK